MAITLDGTNGIAAPNVIGLNAIINGNFGVNQRIVSGTVTLAAGAYGHDRWKAGALGCVYTFATVNNVTTITISAGSLLQVIEGANLFTGTYVLSFTGTAQGKIGAGSYGASGITGSVTGGSNLNIEFNTGTVSLVQFEQGSIPTPFEQRSLGAELERCQRYYQTGLLFIQGFANSSSMGIAAPLIVQMRSTPSVVLNLSASGSYVSSLATQAVTDKSIGFNALFGGSAGAFAFVSYSTDAEL